jgi:hypothetical protein
MPHLHQVTDRVEVAVGAARNFRRFVVFPKDSEALGCIISLFREKGQAQLEALQDRAPRDAPLRWDWASTP